MTAPLPVRSVTLLAVAMATFAAACGPAATPAAVPTASPAATATASLTPTPSPVTTATPSPSPTPSATATPVPATTAAPSPTPAATPVATSAGPTVDGFWARVERGVRDAARLEIAIDGPAAGALRFEPDASATVIEDVVGFVCTGGRAYDGQSGFTRLPGTWTCGAGALVAGFRGIGQPIDAWNGTIPTDDGRRESLVVEAGAWTWRYRATSPYYGGAVSASVTLDAATGRIVAARRVDPTGSTRYTFTYGAKFPPIAVPR